MHDVAIIGAGPAGATLARLLAVGGASVVLLERERLPRYKPCGGGLTRRSLDLLPSEVRHLVRVWPSGALVVYRGQRVRVRSPQGAVGMVMRAELDAALARLAAEAGAELREGATVTEARRLSGATELVAGGQSLRARVVACCDGATGPSAGPLGVRLGLAPAPPRIGALEAELEDPERLWGADLRGDFDLVPGGYGWVFPKGDVLSVGVASWRPGVGGTLLRGLLDAYVSRLGLGTRRVLRRQGHAIPVGGRLDPSRLVGDAALRLGDAAGLADPLFGEGIAHALQSGHLASAAILAGELPQYVAAVRLRILRRFSLAARLARLFYPAPGPWFLAARLVPGLGDRFFSIAVGGGRHAPAL